MHELCCLCVTLLSLQFNSVNPGLLQITNGWYLFRGKRLLKNRCYWPPVRTPYSILYQVRINRFRLSVNVATSVNPHTNISMYCTLDLHKCFINETTHFLVYESPDYCMCRIMYVLFCKAYEYTYVLHAVCTISRNTDGYLTNPPPRTHTFRTWILRR